MARPPRNAPLATAMALALALAGCASGHGGGYRTATLSATVPVTQAFIVPPPGGPSIVAVVEQRYANGLQQDIVLENATGVPGQNAIDVRAYGPMGRDAGRGELRADMLELRDIRRELAQRFPGVPMEVSGIYAQNGYGPISYATGRTHGGVNCIYVWQRISSDAGLFSRRNGAIVWRLRLCDRTTSMRDLLLLAYGMTISGYFLSERWNPYGDPPPPDPRIGVAGETILPEQAVDPTVIAPKSFNEARRERVAAPRPARRGGAGQPAPAPAVLNVPLPGAAVVPRPESTDLSEPLVRGSTLPGVAPPIVGDPAPLPRTESLAPPVPLPPVPLPPGPVAPAPAGRPTPTVPPPPGPRVILPEPAGAGAPDVRVVE